MSQKGTKKKVTLGSGKLYMKEFSGSLPETFKALLADMVKDENHAGWIKGGASIEYKPTMTTEKRALKKAKLRHAEYYDFQDIQDRLYRDSKDGKEFCNLIY